jgi:hypothetical protein
LKQKLLPHLWLKFYVERPLFDGPQLNELHRLINTFLPRWSVEVKVSRTEHSRDFLSVPRDGSLFNAILAKAPPKQGLGDAVLKGAYKGVTFFVDTCNSTLPPELNYLTVEVYRLPAVEELAFSDWAWKFFENVPQHLPTRYAKAHLAAEFDVKNMVHKGGSVQAVGVRLEEALPGLYWLNYFGKTYVRLIGEERLLTSPVYQTKQVGGGVLVALDDSPLNWKSAAYKEREERTINYLGREFFFLKGEPDRQLTAPDFRGE